jgi:hypothetical protein
VVDQGHRLERDDHPPPQSRHEAIDPGPVVGEDRPVELELGVMTQTPSHELDGGRHRPTPILPSPLERVDAPDTSDVAAPAYVEGQVVRRLATELPGKLILIELDDVRVRKRPQQGVQPATTPGRLPSPPRLHEHPVFRKLAHGHSLHRVCQDEFGIASDRRPVERLAAEILRHEERTVPPTKVLVEGLISRVKPAI